MFCLDGGHNGTCIQQSIARKVLKIEQCRMKLLIYDITNQMLGWPDSKLGVSSITWQPNCAWGDIRASHYISQFYLSLLSLSLILITTLLYFLVSVFYSVTIHVSSGTSIHNCQTILITYS